MTFERILAIIGAACLLCFVASAIVFAACVWRARRAAQRFDDEMQESQTVRWN